ncbi:MAG: isoleucine--tRNA ligase [Nitrosopumilus sp. H13]|nr:MAG: isoleucine--tRNA ligase [Nitrosopumilus sp. H13]
MELGSKFDAKAAESQVREYAKTVDVSGEISARDKKMRFIEGPPTMNGIPHAGHLRGRVIKDLWYRFNTLRGAHVEFNGGWDTQGLPVELQVEKELGVTGGKMEAIRQFGIEKIVSECKKVVEKYNREWLKVDEMLGMSFDHDRAYWTFKDEFIEREWQVLRKAHENGILEEDYTVIAYCPSCQTSLSHAEVNQGYEEVRDPSLYYKVRLADEDAYLIVWTTMPFTLVTDAMVGLQPEEDYAYVRAEGQTWIVGKTRLEEFMAEAKIDEYTVQKTVRGSEFEGKKYVHPLLDLVPELAKCAKSENYHVAVSEPFVDVTAGSGLVHLSPANGEEDIKIANRRNVEVFSPIDDQVRFTEQAGRYSRMFVRDADEKVVEDLKERGALVKIGKIKHKYPLCWRSHHRIVWLARRGWFYKLDRLDSKAVDAAEGVEYFFEQPRNRFLGIVKERHPWCISRERIWGCPLPVWDCKECGKKNWFFSRKEITDAAQVLPDGPGFEMHRPWIDGIIVRCSCGSTKTKREEYVLDTWHNSGAAPYASLTDAEYKSDIPAPFFTEGIDQTRGWAYTLLIENVILNDSATPPYNAFLFQGHVLDEKGGKMSKSRGNVIEGADLLAKYPADMVRFYFVWKASPIEPLSFSTDEMMSRPYQVASTLFNLHLYFEQNSRYDKYEDSHDIDWARQKGLLTPPDVWLLSKLERLTDTVTGKNESCRFHESARAIDDFVINVLSQTYVPITRPELWDEDDAGRDRRLAIYAVLSEALRTLDVLIHPFCPFTSEHLYQSVFGAKKSILLESWPQYRPENIDAQVEESFDIMKDVVSVSAAARMKAKLKRRWPLDEARVCVGPGQKKKIEPLSEMLRAQLNVEKFEVAEAQETSGLEQLLELRRLGLPVVPKIELDRKKIGPKAKQHMAGLLEKFSKTDPEDIIVSLQKGGHVFDLGEKIELDAEDFVVGFDAAGDYAASSRDGYVVFVSTSRNKEMTAKGMVKDIARRLQTLRKERGFSPTDVLDVASVVGLDSESLGMVSGRSEELAFLVRVKRVSFEEDCKEYKDEDIDGQKIRVSVE